MNEIAPIEHVQMDMTLSDPCNELFTALATAQKSITNPKREKEVEVFSKRTQKKYKFKYAPLDTIIDHVRKPLTDNGLWFIQTLKKAGDRYCLVTHLTHSSGQWVRGEAPILAEDNANQSFGSGLSYMRRYMLAAILGLANADDDDANIVDRNSAKEIERPGKTALKEQWRKIRPEFESCTDHDQWLALVNQVETRQFLDDLREVIPEWYYGDGKDVEGAWPFIARIGQELQEKAA